MAKANRNSSPTYSLVLFAPSHSLRMGDFFRKAVKISNLLTCATPLTEKIDTILQIIIDTIDNADAGFFLLWQEQQQHLAIKSAINFKEDYYLNDTLLSGEGISGKVFATGQPALFTTTQPMQQAMADLKTTNHDYYLASTVVHGYPKSCMSVPIFYQK